MFICLYKEVLMHKLKSISLSDLRGTLTGWFLSVFSYLTIVVLVVRGGRGQGFGLLPVKRLKKKTFAGHQTWYIPIINIGIEPVAARRDPAPARSL